MKAVIAALTDVPEALRGEYEASKDGKTFVLKLEGDPHPTVTEVNERLAEFRDNNRSLNTTNASLQTQLDKLKGIDPEEHRKLKARIDELEKGGVKDSGDVEARIRKSIAEANAPLVEKIADLEKKKKESDEKLAFRDLEQKITAVGLKIGIDEKAMPDFLNRGHEVFGIDGVARSGDKPLYSKKDVSQPLTIEEWAQGLVTEAPHLFKQTKGGGATGSGGPGRPV